MTDIQRLKVLRNIGIVTLYNLGMSMEEVGKLYGITVVAVQFVLHKFESETGLAIVRNCGRPRTYRSRQAYAKAYYKKHAEALKLKKVLGIEFEEARALCQTST